MTKIVDFALSKARTTLALALLVIVAGSFAPSRHFLQIPDQAL